MALVSKGVGPKLGSVEGRTDGTSVGPADGFAVGRCDSEVLGKPLDGSMVGPELM